MQRTQDYKNPSSKSGHWQCASLLLCLFLTLRCSSVLPGIETGKIVNTALSEASCIVASRSHRNLLWVHNDSGDRARLFAINRQGESIAEIRLEGIDNRDWEDIAIGSGPAADTDFIYLADIGDNRARYDRVFIHRFPEPDPESNAVPAEQIKTLTLRYPDGPRDAEALLFDPIRSELNILSKRELQIHVYRLPLDAFSAESAQPEMIVQLDLHGITGGDISADGTRILLKDYDDVYYWQRRPDESVFEALQRQALFPPYCREPQGEAICWHPNGKSFFTLSEGLNQPLYFYSLKSMDWPE